jgi:hypothetical protein
MIMMNFMTLWGARTPVPDGTEIVFPFPNIRINRFYPYPFRKGTKTSGKVPENPVIKSSYRSVRVLHYKGEGSCPFRGMIPCKGGRDIFPCACVKIGDSFLVRESVAF